MSSPGAADQEWHTDVVPLFEYHENKNEQEHNETKYPDLNPQQQGELETAKSHDNECHNPNHRNHSCFYITMWSPLIELSRDLGPIEIESIATKEKILLFDITPNDVVLFDGLTVHRGRANVSKDTVRPAFYTAYRSMCDVM